MQSLLAANIQHEVVDNQRPEVGLLVLAQIAADGVLELYHHTPGVLIDSLLVLRLLEVVHELLVEREVVLQVDAPDVLRHVEGNGLGVCPLLDQVEHPFVYLFELLGGAKLLAELRHASNEFGSGAGLAVGSELIKLLAGDFTILLALAEKENVAHKGIVNLDLELSEEFYHSVLVDGVLLTELLEDLVGLWLLRLLGCLVFAHTINYDTI